MTDLLDEYRLWRRRNSGVPEEPAPDAVPDVSPSPSGTAPNLMEAFQRWKDTVPKSNALVTPRSGFQQPSFPGDQLYPEAAFARKLHEADRIRQFQENTSGLWGSRTSGLDVLATPGKAFLEALVEGGDKQGKSDFESLVRRYEERSPEEQNQLGVFNPINYVPFGGGTQAIRAVPGAFGRVGKVAREAIPLARREGIALAASTDELADVWRRASHTQRSLLVNAAGLDTPIAQKSLSKLNKGERSALLNIPIEEMDEILAGGPAPELSSAQRNSMTELFSQRRLPIAPPSRLVPSTPEPVSQPGTIQAGFGIGEKPSQGTLGLGGLIEARPSAPLIDAEQVVAKQRRIAEQAAGQQTLPSGRVPNVIGANPPPAPVPPASPGPTNKHRILLRADMHRILRQAEETVQQDRPGAISGVLQKIPGLKQVRAWERPGLEMTGKNKNILVGHVAEALANADVRAQVTASRVPIDRELATAFGKKVVEGDEASVRFLGTPEQATSPLTGTLVDIAENPELYDLTTAQQHALTTLENRNMSLLQSVKAGYGVKIGQYSAKPGGAFLTHIDVPEDFPTTSFSREKLNVAKGQAKHRVYQTARDRLEADPTYKPQLNVTRILDSMDAFKVHAAAGETFREAVGGLTKLEVMKETHPRLFEKMRSLQSKLQSLRTASIRLGGRQKDAIDDFLASPLDEVDLATLQADLHPTIRGQGRHSAKDIAMLRADIGVVKQDIANLRPAWNSADLKPYVFVQEGLYRYFQPEQAALLRELRKVSHNPVLNVLNEIRGGAFSGDLSPFLGVQTPLGVLANPIVSSKMAAGAIVRAVKEKNLLRSFSTRALAEDMAQDPSWREYASFIGHSPRAVPEEFSAGYLGRIPGVGYAIRKFTDASYVVVSRQAKGLWSSMADTLIKNGVPELEAKVAAAGVSSEVFPMISAARLGQSPARQTMIGTVPTSYSFIRQPASLITQATRGYVKMGLKQTLSPQEQLAVRMVTTLAASVMSASVVSAVLSAEDNDEDVGQAALDAVNPDPKNGRFASLVFGKYRVPLGGPYRALFRAIYPREVEGIPVPVPFGGMLQFAQNRLNPAIATQLRLYKNKDFYGRPIREGSFPAQLLQSLYYEMQGIAPLTIGTAIEGVRGIGSGEEVATQTIGQFMGANITPTETARETAAMYERDHSLPPANTSLTILRVAYYQAGEGLLSDAAKRAWRRYEFLPDADQKVFLRTIPASIGSELHKVEQYRIQRRRQLAHNFPDLDVLLVEEKRKAKKPYHPMTQKGRTRQSDLRTEEFGVDVGPALIPTPRLQFMKP